jgi:transposase-like protein
VCEGVDHRGDLGALRRDLWPLDEIYAAVFIDAIVVKVRDGQVANRPFYAAIGVTLDGERDILGLWAGSGGEGAKFS